MVTVWRWCDEGTATDQSETRIPQSRRPCSLYASASAPHRGPGPLASARLYLYFISITRTCIKMTRAKKRSIVSTICDRFHAHINPLTQIALNYPSSQALPLPLCLLWDCLIYDLWTRPPRAAILLLLILSRASVESARLSFPSDANWKKKKDLSCNVALIPIINRLVAKTG